MLPSVFVSFNEAVSVCANFAQYRQDGAPLGSNAAAEKLFETIDPAPGTLIAPVPWRTTAGAIGRD
jgi:hypothetical protein